MIYDASLAIQARSVWTRLRSVRQTIGVDRWDHRGLELARVVGSWSKDPSTQVGAAILRPDRTVASVGFNGLPRGVLDSRRRLVWRRLKYRMARHAEMNAIQFARESLQGHTLYVSPLWPCAQCAGAIIQAGIARVVYELGPRAAVWEEDARLAFDMLHEAGITTIEVKHADC